MSTLLRTCNVPVKWAQLLIALLVTEMIVWVLCRCSYLRLALTKVRTLGFRSLTEPSTLSGALVTWGAGCLVCGLTATSPAMMLLTVVTLTNRLSL